MKRSKAAILSDILTVIRKENEGAMTTHILYKANLSYKQLTLYLNMLVENEFIEISSQKRGKSKKKVYKITDKGQEFLNQFRKLERLSSAFGIDI